MIDVKGLKKTFGDNEVLKGIDEHIYKGEKVVVIGPSGSGKSTFLRCLNLMEIPTEGTILFEGSDITHANDRDINLMRRKMGMVFQHFELFPLLSIRENLVLAQMKVLGRNREEATERGLKLLDRVGLLDRKSVV